MVEGENGNAADILTQQDQRLRPFRWPRANDVPRIGSDSFSIVPWECVDGYQQLRSSRVRVPVMTRCPIGFPIALDGGDLYLEIILGRRAFKWDVRHIDGIVLTFRRSFKARIFFDR